MTASLRKHWKAALQFWITGAVVTFGVVTLWEFAGLYVCGPVRFLMTSAAVAAIAFLIVPKPGGS